ncbi:class I SAM-dependent methyltransferase [Planktomarina temperata]|nr:class I SAM-dependent methyltransferase [bacterium]MDA9971775.1 class I SAM-dependent methyltransferase [Planktomarina temperata]
MKNEINKRIIRSYKEELEKHGPNHKALKWSQFGQDWRFKKIISCMCPSDGGDISVLDLGCGFGDLNEYLKCSFDAYSYHGIDINEEFIDVAKRRYPNQSFKCCDIIETPPIKKFQYSIISGLFNAPKIEDKYGFMFNILDALYQHTKGKLIFNFNSTYNTGEDPNSNYYDPLKVLKYCIENLSTRVHLEHRYQNCDTLIMVERLNED